MATNTTRDRGQASGLRASDAERDTVVTELAEHLKDGRLRQDEFDERMGRAVNARTRGELDGLLTDLPKPVPAPLPAAPRARLPFPLVAIAIFITGMMLLGGISRAAAAGGHPVWAIWWAWWLIPVAIITARARLRTRQPPQ